MPELAEGARLEIVCPAKSGTEGSNPSLSAIKARIWDADERRFSGSRIKKEKSEKKKVCNISFFIRVYLRKSAS